MASSTIRPAEIKLEPYAAEIQLSTLAIGFDNIHYDVFLSPQFVEFSRKYLLELIRQMANASGFQGFEAKSYKAPETGTFRKLLTDLLQSSLTQAKYKKNIELDLLLWLALLKFLTQEISQQFATLLLECKESIRSRGEHFEHSEQAHVLRARIAELQADRRNLYRKVGQNLYQILTELEEGFLVKSRRALFGEEFSESYEMLRNRLLFVEGGKDDFLYLEHYVLLANFQQDPDRFAVFEEMLLDLLQGVFLAGDRGEELKEVLKTREKLTPQALATREELARLKEEQAELRAKLEGKNNLFPRLLRSGKSGAKTELQFRLGDLEKQTAYLERKLADFDAKLANAKQKADFLTEQTHNRLGDFLNQPQNARRLLDPDWEGNPGSEAVAVRSRLLDEWIERLRQPELLLHVLASYELRNIYLDYCPPIHLQQLKKALVVRDELKRVEKILQQFPTRQYSLRRIEDLSRALRRYPREETHAVAIRFAEDLMRLRRDLRNYQRVTALMERVQLIESERTRELSRVNQSLYEFLLPEEKRPSEDRVVAHAVIKADIRSSTRITQDLLGRGLNPASHFSLHLHEPVKRILERYGAVKVFIEGDAIILAIYETELNRSHQRAVAKACLLAREILAVAQAYNARPELADLPRLELGVGVAFQGSAPAIWMDSESRIMISKALNLSDRLSSCSKVARRLVARNASPFNLFIFQTVLEGTAEEEMEELIISYNLNGIELNDEGFQKLSEEIFLASMELKAPMPWGEERGTLYFGEVPIGDSLEPLVLRKGFARQVLSDGKIGAPTTHAYYEVCTSPKLIEMAQAKVLAAARHS